MRPSASVTLPVNIKIASINGHPAGESQGEDSARKKQLQESGHQLALVGQRSPIRVVLHCGCIGLVMRFGYDHQSGAGAPHQLHL
jgi:hypothetical protein